MPLSVETVHTALSRVHDPEIKRPLTDLGMVRDIVVDGADVSVGIDLTTAACPLKGQIEGEVRQAIIDAGAQNVTIDWTVRENARAQIRVIVKRVLRKFGYPPDKQEKATQTVLEQAEVLCRDWTGAAA